jgi:FtsP/CotA-like multicopper oxidase with cupredoxin domain
VTVNGQADQSLPLPQGGMLRLRLLNASVSRIYQLRLQDHPWYLAATDGIALATPVERREVVLAPGERVDLLVPGDQQPGRYSLLSLPYDRGITTMAQDMGMTDLPIPTQPMTLGQVSYQGEQTALSLPTDLSQIAPLPEPDQVRELCLTTALTQKPRHLF